jgi:excisionase family DNA binding protein
MSVKSCGFSLFVVSNYYNFSYHHKGVKHMDKKTPEATGIFTRISQKHTPENQFGEDIRKLNDSLESPEIVETFPPIERLPVVASLKTESDLDQPESVSVRASEKLLLNLTDCRLLTGLSDYYLRDSIKAGTLKAKIIGRGYKIKKQDLDEFVKNL